MATCRMVWGFFLIKLKITLKNTYLAGVQLVDYRRIYAMST